MLFSSAIFLFYFLPCLLLVYFCAPQLKIKNYILLIFSMVFFAWGGIFFTALVFASIIFNFFTGKFIQRTHSKLAISIAIVGNLSVLVFFKYANFIVVVFNNFSSNFDITAMPALGIILPIGISFYTFHSISYNLDVYYKKSQAQTNVFNMALYILLFTQLVAGPIIRYNVFAPQLLGRVHSFEKISLGIERFIIGLGKKIIIANTIGRLADDAFAQNAATMDGLFSWVGIVCYTFQIYFDFSGYSDMAIGLSRIFGFEFPENFNKPYTATSIKDFWQRWHISLSSFFRDYLYIPLGGNQKGKNRTILNLLIVFFLTGLWHGANYTFIVWGLLHGSFLLLERVGLDKILKRVPLFLQHSYAFLIVLIAWIPFRAKNMSCAINYFKSLFVFSHSINSKLVFSYFTTDVVIALALAIIIGFNLIQGISTKLRAIKNNYIINFVQVTQAAFLLVVLIMSSVYIMSGTYNPFIYYQF
jgi:alginate O-acetyltransferase complex protein AlgI